jgi:hypothetical protein
MNTFIALLGIVLCLSAATRSTIESTLGRDTKIHNINQVELQFTNYGQLGPAWWPKGSGHMYIYGAGFWFGTIDPVTGDTLVTIGYGPHGGESECVPGLQGMPLGSIIYMYPSPWPPPADTYPMAPQDHVSHQDSWCCYNDCDSVYHMPGDTRPIGIEVYQTVYAWDVSEIENIIFFTLDFKNISEHSLENCYVGICADCDIGNEAGGSANDRINGIVGRWYVLDGESLWVDNLGYQWQEEEEAMWDEFPGVIGFDLLQTPSDIGMTAFKRFTLDLEPNKDAERYATLAGYNFQTGIYEPYDTFPSGPDDQRFLMSSGPFNLEPDESATMIFAILFANWQGFYITPDTALVLIDKWAQYQYESGWQLSVEEIVSAQTTTSTLLFAPNPVIKRGFITFSVQHAGNVTITLYNIVGQLVKEIYHENTAAGSHSIHFDTYGLAQGTYVLMLETPDSRSSCSLVVLR